MPFPNALVFYNNGSQILLTRDTLAKNWADMPVSGIVRICINPNYLGNGDVETVISGGDAYWAYAEGPNTFVLGVRSYNWLPPDYAEWDMDSPQWKEYVFDKKTSVVTTERDVTGIPGQALVRYA